MFRVNVLKNSAKCIQVYNNFLRFPKQVITPLQQMCTKAAPPSEGQGSVTEKDGLASGVPTKELTHSQKRYMLLAFKHKSVADVPNVMTVTQINKLYARARITVNLMLGFVTLVLCVVTVYTGKKLAERGETLDKKNMDWHKKLREDHQAELQQSSQMEKEKQ